MGDHLSDFEKAFGSFPNEATAVAVKKATGSNLTFGTSSSNQLFRQLLVTSCQIERVFAVRTEWAHVPDEVFGDDAHALSSGECGFAYITGLSGRSDPEAPLVVAPPSKGGGRFDRSTFGGEAAVLTAGGGIRILPIDASGRIIENGMDLLDPRQPFWHGTTPEVKWPE